MPTADAGLTTLIVERIIDTDPATIVVTQVDVVPLDGGSTTTTVSLPPFRGTIQRRADPPVRVAMETAFDVETSEEYVLIASRSASLPEVTPDRKLTFTHDIFGELRITNVHPYHIKGEVTGCVCRVSQVR